MIRWCTYFDRHYLARGLAMIRSLLAHEPDATIAVLCFDDETARIVAASGLRGVTAVPLAALHARDPALAVLAGPRSRWEVYASHKASFIGAMLADAPVDDAVAFIDADSWFFSPPAPVIAELGAASIGLSAHRFAAGKEHLAKYGLYNAGFVVLRNDDAGRRCAGEWRGQCLVWCREETQSDGRFMNQGYLNDWPDRHQGVHVFVHPGANLGPWNLETFALTTEGRTVRVGGQPLVFYHFSGVFRDAAGSWWSMYPIAPPLLKIARERIYRPYIEAITAEERRIVAAFGTGAIGSVRALPVGADAVRLTPPQR